jgi:hypothetical protein
MVNGKKGIIFYIQIHVENVAEVALSIGSATPAMSNKY